MKGIEIKNRLAIKSDDKVWVQEKYKGEGFVGIVSPGGFIIKASGQDKGSYYKESLMSSNIKIYEWKEDGEMEINIIPCLENIRRAEKEKQGELFNNEMQRVKELSSSLKRKEEGKMKERFTTLQVLRLLTERGDMTFESVTEGRKYKAAAVGPTVVIVLECAEGEYCPATTIPMDIMWVEQDKPSKAVSFLDAVRAFDDGREIYSVLDGIKSEYSPTVLAGEQMVDNDGVPTTTEEILKGVWYVKGV